MSSELAIENKIERKIEVMFSFMICTVNFTTENFECALILKIWWYVLGLICIFTLHQI